MFCLQKIHASRLLRWDDIQPKTLVSNKTNYSHSKPKHGAQYTRIQLHSVTANRLEFQFIHVQPSTRAIQYGSTRSAIFALVASASAIFYPSQDSSSSHPLDTISKQDEIRRLMAILGALSMDHADLSTLEATIEHMLAILDSMDTEELELDFNYIDLVLGHVTEFYDKLDEWQMALRCQERFLHFCERVTALQSYPFLLLTSLNRTALLLFKLDELHKAHAYWMQTKVIGEKLERKNQLIPAMIPILSTAYGYLAVTNYLTNQEKSETMFLLQEQYLLKIFKHPILSFEEKVLSLLAAVNANMMLAAALTDHLQEAMSYFERARRLCTQFQPMNSHDEKMVSKLSLIDEHIQARLARFLVQEEAEEEAKKVLVQLCTQQEKIYGKDSIHLVPAISHLGVVHYRLGEHRRALEFLTHAIQLIEKDGSDHERWKKECQHIYLFSGKTSQELGEFTRAKKYYDQALSLTYDIEGYDSEQAIVLFNELGSLAYQQKQITQSIQYFEAAFSLTQQILTLDHPLYYTVMDNFSHALIHPSVQQAERAKDMLQSSLTQRRHLYQTDPSLHLMVSSGLSNLANTLLQLGEIERAHKMFEEALDISRKHIKRTWDPHSVTLAYQYSQFLMKQQKIHHAKIHLEKALGVCRKHPNHASSQCANILTSLATCYCKMNQEDVAIVFLQEALLIWDRLDVVATCPDKLNVDIELAKLWIAQDKHLSAHQHLQKILDTINLDAVDIKQDEYTYQNIAIIKELMGKCHILK